MPLLCLAVLEQAGKGDYLPTAALQGFTSASAEARQSKSVQLRLMRQVSAAIVLPF